MEPITTTTSAPVQGGVSTGAPAGAFVPKSPDARGGFRGGAPGSDRGRGPRKFGSRDGKERVKPEFDSKIIAIRRVTRVAAGGRRFSFSVAVVAGDRRGRVGVGLGKAVDTSLAIDKATRDAKKHMIKVPLSAQMTIPHGVNAKFCSSVVSMMPARGRGIVAGSSVRTVIELAGIKDIAAKLLSGSKNKINNARVAVLALSKLSRNTRATLKGKKVEAEITAQPVKA